jgi:SNF2 family DNA or RNA helicase
VGLPPKHVLVERVPLSPEEADFYEAVRSRSKVLP